MLLALKHVNLRANNVALNFTAEETNTVKVGRIRGGFPAAKLISSPIFKIWKNVSMWVKCIFKSLPAQQNKNTMWEGLVLAPITWKFKFY